MSRQYSARGNVRVRWCYPNSPKRCCAAFAAFVVRKARKRLNPNLKRRIKSRLLRCFWIRNRKNALDVSEKGVLRKDDLFEVVFNPGSDKREKRILGQVSP